MGVGDRLQQGTPLNTHKQDWEFYPFLPGRGGGSTVLTGVTRYTFWIDFDPFDVSNRSMITQNHSFQIFSDSGATLPLLPMIITDQSNDIPDEVIESAISGLAVGNTVDLQRASILYPNIQPPYNIKTEFSSQPADSNYQNDQGYYSAPGYVGIGVGFGQTNMLLQSFVPTQSQFTGFVWESLFHTVTGDHTTYQQVNFELWTSAGFYASVGSLLPIFNSVTNQFNTSGVLIDAPEVSYTLGDDGNNYWTTIIELTAHLTKPVALTPGATYYLVARLATLTPAQNYYFLGANINSDGVYSGLGRYIYGGAYIATDGSSSFSALVDANGATVDFPFVTQGNAGRDAVIFWWGNIGNGASNYWFGTPTTNEFKFIHLSYNQRI